MNVLSLFDGMSCGQIALEKVGFQVDNYFDSEKDKYAIKVAKANYPDMIPLGDLRDGRTAGRRLMVENAGRVKSDRLTGGSL